MTQAPPMVAKNKQPLWSVIGKTIKRWDDQTSFNRIDISGIEDFSVLGAKLRFNANVLTGDTGRATDMMGMFSRSEFYNDLLHAWLHSWNVFRVINFAMMVKHSRVNHLSWMWHLMMWYKSGLMKTFKKEYLDDEELKILPLSASDGLFSKSRSKP